jgi:hypothetical protein
MNHQFPQHSSSHSGDDQLLNESTCLYTTPPTAMLKDIEKTNRMSSNVSLLQLDQATALIRAG